MSITLRRLMRGERENRTHRYPEGGLFYRQSGQPWRVLSRNEKSHPRSSWVASTWLSKNSYVVGHPFVFSLVPHSERMARDLDGGVISAPDKYTGAWTRWAWLINGVCSFLVIEVTTVRGDREVVKEFVKFFRELYVRGKIRASGFLGSTFTSACRGIHRFRSASYLI